MIIGYRIWGVNLDSIVCYHGCFPLAPPCAYRRMMPSLRCFIHCSPTHITAQNALCITTQKAGKLQFQNGVSRRRAAAGHSTICSLPCRSTPTPHLSAASPPSHKQTSKLLQPAASCQLTNASQPWSLFPLSQALPAQHSTAQHSTLMTFALYKLQYKHLLATRTWGSSEPAPLPRERVSAAAVNRSDDVCLLTDANSPGANPGVRNAHAT